MPWIQNIAAIEAHSGLHKFEHNTVLIQIMDPDTQWWPKSDRPFKSIHQFQFLDVDEKSDADPSMRMDDKQAQQIVAILKKALLEESNVVVHCVAGLCRSGAVCEVGVMMGFDDTHRFRSPNTWVKRKLMSVLGWTYENH